MQLTQTMLSRIEAAIERNLSALQWADERGSDAVVALCHTHHVRLRRVSEYLYERLSR
ncbi:hypothetical protein R5W24_004423 [Gemmata sp. JC717]|uniref:hypothetical protein n=1 Tax=Gemmata algarum TaxID=2975278 RepID=UPI0021BA46E1|nr:hypothetical protein [Gemmata algarum]MDY3555282.1 hypothetical protein [Gemmata algarum]